MESPLDITLGARMSGYLHTSNDFKKQRKRINKRLVKLRQELDLITKDTKNYSSKQKISSISVEDYDKDKRYGLLILLTAERDMLYAMEIKNLLENTSSNNSSYKNLMISKIKKSCHHCKHLLIISANESDIVTKLELYIYSSLIQGQLSINQKKWSQSLNAFAISKCCLDYLSFIYRKDSKTLKNSPNDQEISYKKTLIDDIIDNLVDASLNLTIKQEGFHESTTDLKSISRKHCHDDLLPYLSNGISLIESIDSKFLIDISTTVDLIKSIQWRSHEASLHNDEVAFKIMNVSNLNWEYLNRDQFVDLWSEILQLHLSDCEKNQDIDDEENIQDRAITLTFIKYNLIFAKIKRDSSIETDGKTSIKLFTAIISLILEAKELPGVFNDEELLNSLRYLEFYFTCLKDLVLANAFKRNNQYQQALKIYNHYLSKLSELQQEFPGNPYQVSFPLEITNNAEFDKLKQLLQKNLRQLRILVQLSNQLNQNNDYVIENLNKYPSSNLKIVNLSKQPQLHPILSKPVLFDMGYNYINYDLKKQSTSDMKISSSPNITNEVELDQESNKKRGFFGIFGGR